MFEINQLWHRDLNDTAKANLDKVSTLTQRYILHPNDTRVDCTEHAYTFFDMLTESEASRVSRFRNCTQTPAVETDRLQMIRNSYPGYDFEGRLTNISYLYDDKNLPRGSATIGILAPDPLGNSNLWHAVVFAKNDNNVLYLVDMQYKIKYEGPQSIINNYLQGVFDTNNVGLYFVKSAPIRPTFRNFKKGGKKGNTQKNKLRKNKSRKNKSRKNKLRKNKKGEN